MSLAVRIIGPGRAGGSFAAALAAAGQTVDLLDRNSPVSAAAADVDVVLIATPDSAIASVASAIEPDRAAVLHCSGATGLDVLAGHSPGHGRAGSIHPLMALPNAQIGASRLGDNCWFAIAGDPVTQQLVDLLGGRSFHVNDDKRPLYHATAAVSANHLVTLLAQVERLAAAAGVPAQAFLDMAQHSLDDVVEHGAAAALTGPAARGDHVTLDAHRAALPATELALYNALATAATTLATSTSGSDPDVAGCR